MGKHKLDMRSTFIKIEYNWVYIFQRSARAVGRPRRGRSEGLTKPSNRLGLILGLGLLLVVVRGLLAVASLVVEHGL